MLATINTLASSLITRVSKSVAVARLTSRESPMIVHTCIAFSSFDFIVAVALARFQIAKVILRTSRITITRFWLTLQFD